VDLGGVDGLIHISELDHTHVSRPSEVLKVGDKVEVYILSVNRERKRVALSRKRLQPDPWDAVIQDLDPGEVVKGNVTNVVDFGAFVDLGSGVEGLVHVSDMPYEEKTLGELEPRLSVDVQVLAINEQQRQVSLKLERILQPLSPDQDKTSAEIVDEEGIGSEEKGDDSDEV
jgi:ribosomal protein S1